MFLTMCQAISLSETKIFFIVLKNFKSVEFAYSVHPEYYMSLTNHLPLKTHPYWHVLVSSPPCKRTLSDVRQFCYGRSHGMKLDLSSET